MCMVLFANFCLRNDAGRVELFELFSFGPTGYGFPVDEKLKTSKWWWEG